MAEAGQGLNEATQNELPEVHVYRHLTRRDKLMRRVVAPLVIAAGIATTGVLSAEGGSESSAVTPQEASLKMVLEEGKEIVGIIPEVTVLNGAHFREGPNTDYAYQHYSDFSEVNGASIRDSTGITIRYAPVVIGYDPDGSGMAYWIKCTTKNLLGGRHISYVSISEQTEGVVLVNKNQEAIKVSKDANGILSANDSGRTVQEHQFNQTTLIPKQAK